MCELFLFYDAVLQYVLIAWIVSIVLAHYIKTQFKVTSYKHYGSGRSFAQE
jgi:hypothetical protein